MSLSAKKKLENMLTFRKVMGKSLASCFLLTPGISPARTALSSKPAAECLPTHQFLAFAGTTSV